jgi:hypothetical protein
MKVVFCIDDQNLPLGACVVEGHIYEVEREYINHLDQRVFIIKGIINEGTTKWGMQWIGYKADRFAILDNFEVEEKEHMFALN